jgi:hypothetical protein
VSILWLSLFAGFFLGLAYFGLWSITTCLRKGAFNARGGAVISRQEDPVLFWLGIGSGIIGSLVPLVSGLAIFWISLFGGRG